MYKKILYATDFDDVGIFAAHRAHQIAKENGAQLYLVHVVEPIPAYAYPGFAGFAEVEMSIREQAEKELKQMAEQLEVDKKHIILAFGSIKHEVLRIAKEHKIDLIIAGSHGKHGLAVLLGSTAEAILHGASCDMLIVRTGKEK